MDSTAVQKYGDAHEYAGFWIRFGASLIDVMLLMAITLPLMIFIYGDQYIESDDIVLGFADILINYILPMVATLLFWFYKSATPGKMVVKATIVDAKTGEAPSVKQLVIRYLGYLVSTIPFGLGYLWIGWDSKKQGWHDKLADTVVIRPKNRGVENVDFSGK